MNTLFRGVLIAGALALSLAAQAEPVEIASPDGRLVVSVDLGDYGKPVWSARFGEETVIARSGLGLRFQSGPNYEDGFALADVARTSVDETWEQPWGERRFVHDHHNEAAIRFVREADAAAFILRVRAFDDGFGFRYEVEASAGVETRILIDEVTEFAIGTEAEAFWIPAGEWNRYEYEYTASPVVEATRVHTPVTFRKASGVHFSIHEAALVDYSGMWLKQRRPGVFRSELAPAFDGTKATLPSAFKTPWRTVQVSANAVGLANSDLILNLNEPNALGDVSWVETGKYAGIWWGMHIGEYTWSSGDRHGATTDNAKRYIDFAAEHGLIGVLIEGWNIGWDGEWFTNGETFDFTAPYPDFDIEAVAAYARQKGTRLIGHHETSGGVTNYEDQMADAFALYERLGVTSVKTGYVADGGDLTRRDADGVLRYEWHDGQFAVNHHLDVVKLAAKHRIAINPHEPVKDTGLRRTWPNWITREGARGQEYNAWNDPPLSPDHAPMLAFTRMLSGPMDYTPGIFDLTFKGEDSPHRVLSTLARELALYVVLYSPIQMAADLPQNYEAKPDAFAFIKAVPTDWDQSIALAGEVGDYIVFARKDRASDDWYIGAANDATPRTLSIPLDFLDPGRSYEATIWRDGDGAHYRDNPYALEIVTQTVRSTTGLDMLLAPGGGAAVRLRALP